ncbi:hypothetical protein HF521_016927 [Silurus meridionalis]|uniref:Uncharacterized protein n=1 Tax=Silurus meridionalis TaxID=175797 RepID=A0A8T0BRA2_SILME|nr:hypothetical protein HF521_016927 [Silurus meridionalis]
MVAQRGEVETPSTSGTARSTDSPSNRSGTWRLTADVTAAYYYSAPVHVVPPQQYSVHLTGFNTCYTLLPEPTTPTNVSAAGMFYYNDQAVYNQTPFPMVPPLQQHPSTKRKRKTVRVPTLCFSTAETDTAPRPDDSQSLREDKPELAFQQSDFDLEPVSTTVENSSVSPVIVEHLASAETPADEIEAQEAEPPKNEPSPALRMKATMGSFHLSKSPTTTPCTSQRWRIRGYNIVETFF